MESFHSFIAYLSSTLYQYLCLQHFLNIKVVDANYNKTGNLQLLSLMLQPLLPMASTHCATFCERSNLYSGTNPLNQSYCLWLMPETAFNSSFLHSVGWKLTLKRTSQGNIVHFKKIILLTCDYICTLYESQSSVFEFYWYQTTTRSIDPREVCPSYSDLKSVSQPPDSWHLRSSS